MTNLKIGAFALFLFLPSCVSAPLLNAQITVDDIRGQQSGTLFEARDSEGRARLSVGIETRHQTTRSSGADVLSVQFDDGDRSLEIESVGKGGDYYNAGLNLVNGRLVVRPSRTPNTQYVFNPEDGSWSPADASALQQLYCDQRRSLCAAMAQCNASYDISDERYLTDNCAVLRDTVVWTRPRDPQPEQLAPVYLDKDYLLFLMRNESRSGILVCAIKGETFDPSQCRRHDLGESRENTYALYRRGDDLLITTNRGNVFVAHKSNDITQLRETDGVSFQAYSVTQVGGKTVVGMYPYGELFQWNNSLELMSAPDDDRPGRAQWEAQSLVDRL